MADPRNNSKKNAPSISTKRDTGGSLKPRTSSYKKNITKKENDAGKDDRQFSSPEKKERTNKFRTDSSDDKTKRSNTSERTDKFIGDKKDRKFSAPVRANKFRADKSDGEATHSGKRERTGKFTGEKKDRKFTPHKKESPYQASGDKEGRKFSSPHKKEHSTEFQADKKERKDTPPHKKERPGKPAAVNDELKDVNAKMPLNKYIAHCGVCSRRDAVELIKDGKVTVNNALVTDPGLKINNKDVVVLNGKKLSIQKGLVYVLLNKPKDYITTTEDEKGRKTVMELLEGCGEERLYPVGRLDRNTTGLLLITNDGELAQRLAHPSYKIKKVYHVTLNKALTKADFDKILSGVELEDGKVHVDALAYLEEKNDLGIEIHSGKNRVIRRIFESLDYEVEKLDRVMYAGLTKKNIPRGKWRFLTPHEVILLKHFKI